MKILIAVDGSENSSQALHEIAGRNWADTDEVKIIHVVATPIPVTDMLGVNAEIARDAHAEAVRQGGEILDAAERIIAEEAKGLRMTSEVITAQPFHSAAEEIVNCAGREGSDVVVLGSREEYVEEFDRRQRFACRDPACALLGDDRSSEAAYL